MKNAVSNSGLMKIRITPATLKPLRDEYQVQSHKYFHPLQDIGLCADSEEKRQVLNISLQTSLEIIEA